MRRGLPCIRAVEEKHEYVYGDYIDEPLRMKLSTWEPGVGGAPGTAVSREYFYHCAANYNVVALSDASGEIVEYYEYSDYGAPTIYNFGLNASVPKYHLREMPLEELLRQLRLTQTTLVLNKVGHEEILSHKANDDRSASDSVVDFFILCLDGSFERKRV